MFDEAPNMKNPDRYTEKYRYDPKTPLPPVSWVPLDKMGRFYQVMMDISSRPDFRGITMMKMTSAGPVVIDPIQFNQSERRYHLVKKVKPKKNPLMRRSKAALVKIIAETQASHDATLASLGKAHDARRSAERELEQAKQGLKNQGCEIVDLRVKVAMLEGYIQHCNQQQNASHYVANETSPASQQAPFSMPHNMGDNFTRMKY